MIVFLPSCAYPYEISNSAISARETELNSNLHYLKSRGFSYDQILVIDNGFKRPSLPNGTMLIHDKSLFSSTPQVGEALMTRMAAVELKKYSKILKLHSRCKLRNLHQLCRYSKDKDEFIFIRKNLFRFNRPSFNKCPFAETRLYMISPFNLDLLTEKLIEYVDDSIFFEHAFLSASYQIKQIRPLLVTHGSFYPVFEGMSGHNVSYSSIRSKSQSILHQFFYRLGI